MRARKPDIVFFPRSVDRPDRIDLAIPQRSESFELHGAERLDVVLEAVLISGSSSVVDGVLYVSQDEIEWVELAWRPSVSAPASATVVHCDVREWRYVRAELHVPHGVEGAGSMVGFLDPAA